MSVASQQQIQVLHVDDEPQFTDLTGTFLESEDDRFAVETAHSADDGLEIINDRPPDCVVSDYNMPGMDGLEFLQAVREEYPDLPFILFTGKGSEEVASDAISAGATDYLQKQSGTEQYSLLLNRVQNVVDQYRSEQRLRKTRKEYTAVFENARNALMLVSVEDDWFRYQQCNPQAVELIGREKTEIVGNTPSEALGSENGRKVVGAYRACIEQGSSVEYTITLELPMGQVIRECEVTPVATNGEIEQLVVEFRDVTQQRQRQQEVKEYGTIIDALTDAVYVLDEEGRFTYVNHEFVELVGYDRETILGNTPSLIKDGEAVEQAEHQLGRLLSSDGPDTVSFEVRIQPRDGDPIVCEDHMGILPYDGDEFDGSVGTLRDITDHVERGRELAQTHGLMTNMEKLADAGAWEYDPDTETLLMTGGAYRIHGLDPDADPTLAEAFGSFHPDDRDLLEDRFRDCLETGEPYDVNVRLTAPDGEQRWITARGERVTDSASGNVVRGYIHDITEQKQLECDLKQERDLVTGIVETVPVGLSVVDADGSISFVNEWVESICGRSLGELEGMSHDGSQYDLVDEHGEPLESGETPFNRVASRETTIHDQTVGICRPSGERVWLSVSGAPQWNENGELERAVFAFEDITEQRELEAELSEIFGRISDAFFALDEELRVTHVNGRGEELLEASEDQLLGETLWDMYPEIEESDKIWDSFRAAMDTQDSVSLEFYSPGENWYDVTVYPSESGVSVYFRDVTESKERIQELKQVRNRMEFALESTDAIVWDYDVNEDRATFYPDEMELYGTTVETVDDFVQLIHPDDRQAVADSIEHSIETGEPIHNEFRIIHNGEIRWVDGPGQVVQDDDDTTRMTGVARDITERKESQSRLEAQNERLEEFASIVSHDLRNPISVADGHLELAQETCESTHLVRAADAIDRSYALIDDLLALAQEGQEVVELERVALAEVVENSWQTVDTGPATLENDALQVIRADQSRLRQLFENLHRNAVEHGGDEVTVHVGAMDDGFYVADTGPGIPETEREGVFEAGYSTAEDGTGFGLRIVNQIADAHGWKIAVTESDQGGARFEITGVEFADR